MVVVNRFDTLTKALQDEKAKRTPNYDRISRLERLVVKAHARMMAIHRARPKHMRFSK